MPGMNGIELVRELKRKGTACPVILITGHGDVALAVEAMKAGAVDFIEKPFDDAVLLGAIRAALDAHASVQGDSVARKEAEARLADLSPRERDVLQGLVAGKINKVIAHELNISPRTVEVYRANLMAKTGARSMSELMRIALAAGRTQRRIGRPDDKVRVIRSQAIEAHLCLCRRRRQRQRKHPREPESQPHDPPGPPSPILEQDLLKTAAPRSEDDY